MEEEKEGWRKSNKDIPGIKYVPNVIRVTEPRTKIRVGYVARIGWEQKHRRITDRGT
jgi:hypothetical protein